MKLAQQLSLLERAELVQAFPTAEYIFKHALVQDTAYQSLLKNERKRLHRAIGLALERAQSPRPAESCAELARHFERAGDDEKTFIYARCAGDAAARVFAYPEGHAFYTAALNALSRLSDNPARRRQSVDLIVTLVAVSLRAQGPEWCLEQLRRAENLLRGLQNDPQDRERLARVHFWMGDAYSHLNQQREAITYLQQALDAAQQGIEDETLLAIPSNVIGRAFVAQGRFAQAEPLLRRAAPLLEQSANWYEWVLAVGFLGFALAAQGNLDAARAETNHAFTRAQELGTPVGIGDSHIFASFISHQSANYENVLLHANAALQAAARLNDQLLFFLAHNIRAWAHTRLGNIEDAKVDFERAHALATHMGGQLFFADMFQAAYAEFVLQQGNRDTARELARSVVETAHRAGSLFSEGLAHRVWAQTLASPQADEHFAASIQLFEAGNAQVEAARTRAAWSDFSSAPTAQQDNSARRTRI